jgi:hypothetical protein
MSTNQEIHELHQTRQNLVSSIEMYPFYEFNSLQLLLFRKYGLVNAQFMATAIMDDLDVSKELIRNLTFDMELDMGHRLELCDSAPSPIHKIFCTMDFKYYIKLYFPESHLEQSKLISTNMDRRKLKGVTKFLDTHNTEFPRVVARDQEKINTLQEEIAILETYAEVLGE